MAGDVWTVLITADEASYAYTAKVEQELSPGVYSATGVVTAREGPLIASVVRPVVPR